MYRLASKRMLLLPSRLRSRRSEITHLRPSIAPVGLCTISSSSSWSHTFPDQNPNFANRRPPQSPNVYDSASPSSSTSSQSSASGSEEARGHERHSSRDSRHRAEYHDEQARVLGASLGHVPMMGWTEAAMIAGAREAGVSPSIVGSFPRKEAALVEFFMDECLQKLIDTIDSDESLKDLIPSDRISKIVKIRLELQAPFVSKWAQALSIQSQPQNIPTSFKQRAMLVDEIWHAAGDAATDIDWYTKRTVLGVIYSTTEVYMLTDKSPDFRDTWAFLDGRVKDAFDLKKSIQEVKYLAEAVGAGMGSSLQGFMKNIFQR